MNEKNEKLMEKVVSLAKRRGFVFPSSEIYGGQANTYDFGPYGVALKNNIKQSWWKFFVKDREDMVGLDAAIIMNPKTWEASEHTKEFTDPLVECKKCHKRFRADELEKNVCPACGGELMEPRPFSGLMKTFLGPTEDHFSETYLRPETAQAIFVDFPTIVDTTRKRIPFGVAQIGKAFRSEITPGNFIFRMREFEMMEIEYFFNPKDEWKKHFNMWRDAMREWTQLVGIDEKKTHFVDVPKEDRAHYSQKTVDIEFSYPFGQKELFGLAYRGNFDLSQHQKVSGKKMHYRDPETGEEYLPHVIEPSFGVDRALLAILLSAYREEKINGGEKRIVLKLTKGMAPVKIAVFPLLKNKPELIRKAREIYDLLRSHYTCEFDDNGNIGKRYRRQDEIGTPYCATVDFDSLKHGDVTVRDRDFMEPPRVKITALDAYIKEKLGE